MKNRALFLLPVLALAAAACGSEDPVSVESPWARTSAAGQTTGAIYFDLTVDDDDTLLGASVPASVAGEAQVHEVVMVDDEMDDMDEMSGEMDESGEMEGSDDMDDMDDMSGQMRMQELAEGLILTGGETVTFEPGGYHVMLLDIAAPLESGDEIDLTLEFAEAGSQSVTVEVMETAP